MRHERCSTGGPGGGGRSNVGGDSIILWPTSAHCCAGLSADLGGGGKGSGAVRTVVAYDGGDSFHVVDAQWGTWCNWGGVIGVVEGEGECRCAPVRPVGVSRVAR